MSKLKRVIYKVSVISSQVCFSFVESCMIHNFVTGSQASCSPVIKSLACVSTLPTFAKMINFSFSLKDTKQELKSVRNLHSAIN